MNTLALPDEFTLSQLINATQTPRPPAPHNPTPIHDPVLYWIIQHRYAGYQLRDLIEAHTTLEPEYPVWCFDRMVQSCTSLPDGRQILISGEHEDFYDPDFFIYNDVVVIHPDGQIELFEYPLDQFPPTDFHTTIFDESRHRLIIVGNISHPEYRQTHTTQVAVLDLNTMQISMPTTTGHAPNWLSACQLEWHIAGEVLKISQGQVMNSHISACTKNLSDWFLDVQTWEWSKSDLPAPQHWCFYRSDLNWMHLYEMSRFFSSIQLNLDSHSAQQALLESIGTIPSLTVFEQLFQPPIAHQRIEREDENCFNRTCLQIDNQPIQYIDEMFCIELIMPHEFDPVLAQQLIEDLRSKLSLLENIEIVALDLTDL